MRAVYLTAAAALALMLIAPTTTSAASPDTLGMRVTAEVYGNLPSPAVSLTSRATAPTLVELQLPQGWTLDRTQLEMLPGQEVSLPFLSVGATSTMSTRQTLLETPAGTTAGALVLKTKLLSERPVPQDWTLAWTLALVLAALLVTLLALRWARHNLRLTRR